MGHLAGHVDEIARRTVAAQVEVRFGEPPHGSPPGGSIELLVTRSGQARRDPLGSEVATAPRAQIRYHGTPLAEGTLSATELRLTLPFSGGTLDPLGFTGAVTVPGGDEGEQYAVEVTVTQPRLSVFERRVTDRLELEVERLAGTELESPAPLHALLGLRSKLVLTGKDP